MRAVVFVGLMLFGVAAFGQDTGPIEVARLPSYTEGPTFDNEGNLFVSEPFGNNVTTSVPMANPSCGPLRRHRMVTEYFQTGRICYVMKVPSCTWTDKAMSSPRRQHVAASR